jgi:pyruvate-formate lyase-activating enzyme
VVVTARHRADVAASLIELVGSTATGSTVMVPVTDREEVGLVHRWCQGTGNSVFAIHDEAVEVYRGSFPDSAVGLSADRRPGYRLWLYTNFHCNLACDYCCVESSPRAHARLLSPATVERLVAEALEEGAGQIYLTGGEPFLHPDIASIVQLCVAAAPTVVLTNAMLFRGSRLAALEEMPREGLTLQVSLDSASPDLHDLHRGAGSWQRALDGVRMAQGLGFTVRLATTLASDARHDTAAFADLCAELRLDPEDMLVRTVARQGSATAGILVSRATVVPEVCVTSSGVYWHPVAALDPAMRVSSDLHPLGPSIRSITEEFLRYRRAGDVLAATFPCA